VTKDSKRMYSILYKSGCFKGWSQGKLNELAHFIVEELKE